MKTIKTYQNKKVLVLGLAKSGVSAAKLLHELGALVTVNDSKEFDKNPEAQDLLSLGIRVITGSHPVELLDEEFSVIVKNPGIPYSNPLIKKAISRRIPIITEVELSYQVSDSTIIGITGTNGKTTTTTMIGRLLNEGRKIGKAYLAGNIGFPASEVVQNTTTQDEIVMELSSFQLMGIDQFHPKIAVITNIYEAHLDYHQSREEYIAAKWALQKNMEHSDFLVLNWNQKELQALSQLTKATILPFSTKEKVDGAYLLDGKLFYKEEYITCATELGVPGMHNVENALASIIVARLHKIPIETIRTSLRRFSGVNHRTQFIGEIQGRKFYNDSKATNILATQMAVAGFEKKSLVLLAGGLDRGNSFDELLPTLTSVKALVLFGETKEKLKEVGIKAGITSIYLTDNVEEAVAVAYRCTKQGDTILLSPACASWDQSSNYEVRGEKFIQSVKQLNVKEKRDRL